MNIEIKTKTMFATRQKRGVTKILFVKSTTEILIRPNKKWQIITSAKSNCKILQRQLPQISNCIYFSEAQIRLWRHAQKGNTEEPCAGAIYAGNTDTHGWDLRLYESASI
jgi:hypothetical protein